MSRPPDDDDAPWRRGVDARGVQPPGRRFSKERRDRRWSASGVRGVTPPGHMPKERRTRDLWSRVPKEERAAAARALEVARRRTARGLPSPEVPAARPVAGARPRVELQSMDIRRFAEVFERLRDRLAEDTHSEESAEELAMAIRQSMAPFEIVAAFAALTAAVRDRKPLRRRHGRELERGMECYLNLAQRLGLEVPVPEGFEPQRLDPLFHDLPDEALSLPFAHLTLSLEGLTPLFDPDVAERSVEPVCREFRDAFIRGRTHGDRSLEAMFPPPEMQG
ncbi:MAG TPA: hypothetical protein RMG48_21190 [Myxococcales bacterium LLY-WYZ-16_1]|nr:hypothetical protein [Myxococcales bacterium LLY-WYZ-16_1]